MHRLQSTGQNLGRVFNSRSGRMCATHLCCCEGKRSNLKLKTQTKQILGSLPLICVLTWSIDIESLQNRLLKVCYVPATSAGLPRLSFFFFLFLLRPLTVLMKQTRQVVRAIKQSILLRCLCLSHRYLSVSDYFAYSACFPTQCFNFFNELTMDL